MFVRYKQKTSSLSLFVSACTYFSFFRKYLPLTRTQNHPHSLSSFFCHKSSSNSGCFVFEFRTHSQVLQVWQVGPACVYFYFDSLCTQALSSFFECAQTHAGTRNSRQNHITGQIHKIQMLWENPAFHFSSVSSHSLFF